MADDLYPISNITGGTKNKNSAPIKLESPEKWLKNQNKKSSTNKNKVSSTKAEKLRKRKENAIIEMEEGFIKLKEEFLKTALFTRDSRVSKSKKGGGNVKVIRNLDLQVYVLESLRANMSASQTIFLLAGDFNLTPESAKQYYWQTIKYLRNTIDDQTKDEMKYILTKQMESVQRLAIIQGDLKSAIKCGELVGKLGGLFEPEKIDINTNVDFTLSFPKMDVIDDEQDTEKEDDINPDLDVNEM